MGAAFVRSLRDGTWLTRQRLTFYPILTVIAVAIGLPIGAFLMPRGHLPVGTDFVATWAADTLGVAGRARDAYDLDKIGEAEQAAIQGDILFPFPYPPTYLLLTEPFGHLSFPAGLIVWEAVGAGAFLIAMLVLADGRGLWLSLAFPGLIINGINGQNGLLLAAPFALALALLAKRPVVAGVLIGLMSIKPHLGLLIPFALIAGGHRRCFAAAATTVVVLIGLSIMTFGFDPWRDFFGTLNAYRTDLLQGNDPALAKLVSSFANARRLGTGLYAAYAVQGVVSVFAAGCVIVAWRSTAPLRVKQAVLVFAGLLATPYLFDYDLAVLAPGLALAALVGLEDGFKPWEKSALALLWVLPGIARVTTLYTGLPIAPVVLLLSLFLMMRRCVGVPRLQAGASG